MVCIAHTKLNVLFLVFFSFVEYIFSLFYISNGHSKCGFYQTKMIAAVFIGSTKPIFSESYLLCKWFACSQVIELVFLEQIELTFVCCMKRKCMFVSIHYHMQASISMQTGAHDNRSFFCCCCARVSVFCAPLHFVTGTSLSLDSFVATIYQ